MSIVIAVKASGLNGVPRDTLVHLLAKCRVGGKASILTRTPHNDMYYAVIDTATTAVQLKGVLSRLCIEHRETALPEGIKLATTPATPSSASHEASPAAQSGQRAWTGDARVDKAISDYLTDLFEARPGTVNSFMGFPAKR